MKSLGNYQQEVEFELIEAHMRGRKIRVLHTMAWQITELNSQIHL